jgi:hypothetical protein
MRDSVMTMYMIHVHFDRCQQSQDSESRAPCLRVYSHFLTQTHLYPVREPPAPCSTLAHEPSFTLVMFVAFLGAFSPAKPTGALVPRR